MDPPSAEEFDGGILNEDASLASAEAAANFLNMLDDLNLNIEVVPDSSSVQMSQPCYIISTCSDEPQVLLGQIFEEEEGEKVQEQEEEALPTAKSSGASKKKRQRVVVNKKGRGRRASSSSNSFSSSFSSSPNSSTPKKAKSEPLPTASNSNKSAHCNVCRFHCKQCGQVRFLLVRSGLPARLCECGSTCVSMPSWARSGHGLTGGLGREGCACQRCFRIYSSDNKLRLHKCRAQVRNVEDDTVLGVSELPSCHICKDSFIFDSLLAKHIRKQHK